MQPARLRRGARSDELPILLQADPEKQPIKPGEMIRNQQHRTGGFQRLHVVSPEAEHDPEQKVKESFHGSGKCCMTESTLQTKYLPANGKPKRKLNEVIGVGRGDWLRSNFAVTLLKVKSCSYQDWPVEWQNLSRKHPASSSQPH